MDKKDPKELKFNNLIKKTIIHFNQFKNRNWVVKPSIPILFFGNLENYKNSKLKIITVALNPSDKEFPITGKPRFSFCPQNLTDEDVNQYIQTLSDYFEKSDDHEPYDLWFNKQTERIMNEMNASYYIGFKHMALHTDLCSPIATSPTWGDLEKTISSEDYKQLKEEGYEIWLELMKLLKPDILLVSVDKKKYLHPNGFTEKYLLRDLEDQPTSFSKEDLLMKKNKEIPKLSSKDIFLYEHPELPKTKIYFGSKCSGIPFSNFAYSSGRNGVEDLIEIKKVANLIKDDFGISRFS